MVTNFGGNLESNLTKTHHIRNFPPHFQGRVEKYIFLLKDSEPLKVNQGQAVK